jgi:hypothetical protein
MLLDLATWVPILDGEELASAAYERHYSSAKTRRRRMESGAKLFIGPGWKLVLSTPDRLALFAWRKARYRADRQTGVECTIFRNEGASLSSALIRAADVIADRRWPGDRHFTMVDPFATSSRRSAHGRPGACFRHAGWTECGETKRGLVILERLPR